MNLHPASAVLLPRTRPPKPRHRSDRTYSLRHRHRIWVLHQKLVIFSFLGDSAVVLMSLLIAYLLRFETGLREIGVLDPEVRLESYLGHVLLGSVLLVALLGNLRLQDPRKSLAFRQTFAVILKACVLWFGIFLAATLILKIEPPISRVFCGLGAGIALLSLTGWRWILYCILRREPIASGLRQRVVFVGWNSECELAVERFGDGRARQFEVIGVVAPQRGRFITPPPAGVRVLGRYREMRRILRERGADVVMAVDGSADRGGLLELAETCGKEFVDFKLVPSCFHVLVSGLKLESIHGMPVLGIGMLPLHHAFNNTAKRALDIVGAICGLVLFAPVMAVFMALVHRESSGPVIYRQRRIGRNGRPFDILKIRSMKLDAEAGGAPGWTVKDDPRRLRVGAFMRRWNIDELPQFWNVLAGDMSMVGPRPERPELIEGFKEEIPNYNVRHNIKPGLTGWAQVNGLRGDTCLRERIKFDLAYIEHWHFFFDLKILVMTLLHRKGAC